MQKSLTIATRKSPLALWQAYHVRDRLEAMHPDLTVELLEMTTQGDERLDVSLQKIGGKGVFVKELETALYDGRADLAVHSLKDVPMELPEGLELCCFTARETPFDAVVTRDGLAPWANFDAIPEGAHLGTSSLRRMAQIRALRPDLKLSPVRGNLGTRLRNSIRVNLMAWFWLPPACIGWTWRIALPLKPPQKTCCQPVAKAF